jgi:6-pyruvoyl tetrahydropterin synthase/QueD family protein
MIFLTRHEHFNAAHKLYNPGWSEEKNIEVFGKCANTNWHGHNYNLIVTIKGEVNEDTGFLMDAKKLSAILSEHVCEKIDHKNLNLDVDFMFGKLNLSPCYIRPNIIATVDKSNVIRNIGKLRDEKINQVIATIIEILQKPCEPTLPASKAWKRGKNPKS